MQLCLDTPHVRLMSGNDKVVPRPLPSLVQVLFGQIVKHTCGKKITKVLLDLVACAVSLMALGVRKEVPID